MNTTGTAAIKLSVEVITLPVSDVERALRFYVDQVGFTLDVDYAPNNAFRVVQLTPPGSSCSIQFGSRLTGPHSLTRRPSRGRRISWRRCRGLRPPCFGCNPGHW